MPCYELGSAPDGYEGDAYSDVSECNENCGPCVADSDCAGLCTETATAMGCYCLASTIEGCGGLLAGQDLESQCAAAGGIFTPPPEENGTCICFKVLYGTTEEICPTLPRSTDYSGSNMWSTPKCCNGNCTWTSSCDGCCTSYFFSGPSCSSSTSVNCTPGDYGNNWSSLPCDQGGCNPNGWSCCGDPVCAAANPEQCG